MAYAILKPATVSNIQGGASGTDTLVRPASTGVTHVLAVKILEFEPDFFSQGYETTGGNDVVPVFENNALVYGTIAIRGWVFAGTDAQLFLLTSLQLQNPGQTAVPAAPWVVTIGASSSVTWGPFTVFLERVRFSVRKNAEGVGVSIIARLSQWTPTDL